jgi:hypothetical protein
MKSPLDTASEGSERSSFVQAMATRSPLLGEKDKQKEILGVTKDLRKKQRSGPAN